MTVRIVCVLVIHGLMVNAFPTGDYDGEDPILMELPVEGVAEFSGTVPATGSCSIVGHSPCSPILPYSIPFTPTPLENNDTVFIENDEVLTPIDTENDGTNKIPNQVILGAILADAITAEKGADIDAKLAELDAFVEAEIGQLGPLIQTAVANADTAAVDEYVDSALHGIESQIATELAMIDELIDSELAETETVVESFMANADFNTADNLNPPEVTEMETADMTQKEALVALQLAILGSLVELELNKTESIIESELEKVNTFVESELAKVDDIVESELAKVDLFMESELAQTDALVQSELAKVESFVESELAKVEKAVEEVANLNMVSAGTAKMVGDCNCPPVLFDLDGNIDDTSQLQEEPSMVYVSGTFPVTGRTLIFGSTGCPPLFPTAEPLPLHLDSFPILDTIEYSDSYEPEPTEMYDDSTELPVVGEAVFSGVTPAVGSCKIQGHSPYAAQPQITMLPTVNLRRSILGYHGNPTGPGSVDGNLGFGGTTRAAGSTSLFGQFSCHPLMPTVEGPDGKKYIWISKKSSDDTPSRPRPRPRPDFPSTYSSDFPETIIMDSSKNYEKLLCESLEVDFGLLGPLAGGSTRF